MVVGSTALVSLFYLGAGAAADGSCALVRVSSTDAKQVVARYGAAAAADGDRFLLVGGSSPRGYLGLVESFDPKQGVWRTVADGLTPRRYLSAVVVDGALYVVGGENQQGPVSAVERVDLRTGRVIEVAPLPTPRTFASAAVLEDSIYVIGGSPDGDAREAMVEIYDPAKNMWSTGPPLRSGRDTRTVRLGDELYALGGYAGRKAAIDPSVERLSAGASRWTAATPMPSPTSAFSAAVAPDQKGIFVFGDYRSLGRVARYDLRTERWSEVEIDFTPRRHSAAATVGHDIIVFGGNVSSQGSWLARIEIFRLACPKAR